MNNTSFSVLMSVYHKETPAFLDRALRSNLEEQTLPPAQLVLVCDGPLNGELDAVIDKYLSKHPNTLSVCRLKENGGLGKALNYGLHLCNHELIARADSDDICLPRRFELQIAYMNQHPEVAAASGAIAEFVNSPDDILRKKHMPSTHSELCRYAQTRNPLNHMATIFRKGEVLSAGGYPDLLFVEDYYLWVKLLVAGKVLGNIQDVLVLARIGNGMEERRKDRRLIVNRSRVTYFMYEHQMLTLWQHLLNLARIRVWCVLPGCIRRLVYRMCLRRKGSYC